MARHHLGVDRVGDTRRAVVGLRHRSQVARTYAKSSSEHVISASPFRIGSTTRRTRSSRSLVIKSSRGVAFTRPTVATVGGRMTQRAEIAILIAVLCPMV